jgi:Flp pilus assembly protein CpaB
VRRRWTRASRVYLCGSAVLALATGEIVHTYVARAAAAADAVRPTVPVVVTVRTVHRGSVVEPGQVRVVVMPRAYAPPGAFHHIQQAAGRVALADLATGEAVTATRLARVRAGPVASLIPPGLRAFAVPTSLPAGAVRPGDRVDVLGTYQSGQPHTERVVSAVEVLFVLGPHTGGSGGGGALDLDPSGAGGVQGTTLIVLVASDQEDRLAFARAFANLEVVLAPAVDQGGDA